MARIVELGFVEPAERPFLLSSLFQPSKIGGKPAWLNWNHLPKRATLTCRVCGDPLMFLLQVYAPIDDEGRSAHRTLFLFCCKNGRCYRRVHGHQCFLALSNSLAESNPYYTVEPLDEDLDDAVLSQHLRDLTKKGPPLCHVCGVVADKRCGACMNTWYCCSHHQKVDWAANHKRTCGSSMEDLSGPNSELLSEYEIVIEDEEVYEVSGKSELEQLEDCERIFSSIRPELRSEQCSEELELTAKQIQESMVSLKDKSFLRFNKWISPDPDQVLRYDRGGEPLWTTDALIPKSGDIPDCPRCNGKRAFEFQVLPQLLNHLGQDALQDSMDWANLVVYTCEKNCGEVGDYHEEFVWKQDFLE